jgi:flagellin
MANIGATTAFYKVETSLTRANSEVSKSMERLATGKANANAGDRSSYVAMADTFRLDFVGTKAGIKGASVVMGYLETGMRVLDSASGLLSRLQELAVLGANDTNTDADHEAINLEAEAIADEFNRLMQTSTYKGKDVFVASAGGEYVSMGGRDSEMTFGIGEIDYTELYDAERTIAAGMGPNAGTAFNLKHLASDAAADITLDTLIAGETYIVTDLGTDTGISAAGATQSATSLAIVTGSDLTANTALVVGTEFTITADRDGDGTANEAGTGEDDLDVSASDIVFSQPTNTLTQDIEAVQAKINTARVQAGSQYAALESAVNYTTDLTAQYELGYNVVNDVNFSMETAHLAKNQILQQAATAMLAQANQGQQGLLQLIS